MLIWHTLADTFEEQVHWIINGIVPTVTIEILVENIEQKRLSVAAAMELVKTRAFREIYVVDEVGHIHIHECQLARNV